MEGLCEKSDKTFGPGGMYSGFYTFNADIAGMPENKQL